MLGQVGIDQVGGDRRDLVEPRLAELALDIVLLGEAEAAMRLQAHIGGGPGGIGGQQLRHVGFLAAGNLAVIHLRRALDHQRRRFRLRIGLGDRELDALILPDRAAEHLALIGIAGGLGDEPAGIADAFGGDQDALRIHAVQDVAEALAFLADQVLRRHFQIVQEDFRGGVVQHGADRADGQPLAQRLFHIDQEDRKPLGLLRHLVLRRGAGQQDHQVGMFRPAGPDLLAVHDVFVALAHRHGADRGGVGARRRLGHAESLQAQLAGGDLRQVAFLLLLAAVPQDGADITFHGFDRRLVYLHMKGACAGCPSSTLTLKMGIENLLRHYIPEVTEVRPVAV